MYAHEYICFFTKYEYFMYFLVSRFFVGSGPVHILGFAGSMTGPVPITLVQSQNPGLSKLSYTLRHLVIICS